MRKVLPFLLVPLLVGLLQPDRAMAFLSDLAGHWSATMIGALEARGIVNGDEFGRFNPDAPLTRAQLAKLLTVGMGFEGEAMALRNQPSRYQDVAAWHWASGYIESSAELGLADGYPDGRFGPEEPVNRAQLAVFAIRTLGLADRARLSSAEPTPFTDDAEIPGWARGFVFVAYREGILTGLPDGRFDPNRTVTRAEGSTTIFRLLARKGILYNLSGTLVRYRPAEGTGTVRDSLGHEQAFSFVPGTAFLRQGAPVPADQIRLADQVLVILDQTGKAVFLEARYQDLLADRATLVPEGVRLDLSSGESIVQRVQAGALISLNGHAARLDDLPTADHVYVVFDQTTGEIRLIDAVRVDQTGLFVSVDEAPREVSLLSDFQQKRYKLAPDLVVVVNGEVGGLDLLIPGEEIRLGLDAEQQVIYMEATR